MWPHRNSGLSELQALSLVWMREKQVKVEPLGGLLNLCEPQSLHLYHGDKDRILLWSSFGTLPGTQ